MAALLTACSRGVSRLQQRVLPASNPTSFEFAVPLEQLHAKALEAFSIDHQVREPIFALTTSNPRLETTLIVESSTNAVMGEKVLSVTANTNDFYLHSFHSPFVVSQVYHGKWGGMPFIASFQVHLAPKGSNTLVSVTATDCEVINGTKFGFGSCGPGQGWNCVRVQPTTIEEYSILLYLGRYFGATNMPPMVLPK